MGEAAEHARLLAPGALVQQGAHGGIGQLRHALGLREPHDLAPSGNQEQGAVGAKTHVHGDERRHGEGDDAPARCGRRRRRRELVLNALGGTGVDRQHVPVEGPVGRDAHGGHEVDLLGAERVETAVGDVLEGRPLVGAHLLAEGQHLAAVRVARADRPAVTVGVGARLRGREPKPSRLERLGQQRPHRGDLVVGRDLFAPLRPHHLAAQRAVPHQEPGVHAQPPVERTEVLGEAGPVPRDAVLQGGQGHALHLGHHLADVVGILGIDRGQSEAAVAADHGGHAVHVGGGGLGVPEQLGVVVRVRVDHPGGDDQPGGIELGGGGLVDLAHGDDPPVADPDVSDATGLTGAVDERAGSDDVVEHGTSGTCVAVARHSGAGNLTTRQLIGGAWCGAAARPPAQPSQSRVATW